MIFTEQHSKQARKERVEEMRTIFRLVCKVFLLPVIAVLTILQWIGTLAAGICGLIFALAGGVFIVTGILSCFFGQEPVSMMWRMITTGAGICLFPRLLEWTAVQITYLNLLAKSWILS